MNDFKQAILRFNEQLSPTALRYFHLKKLSGFRPDAIVVLGMGGSGQIGDLIAGLAAELKIPVPVAVWKDWGLEGLILKNKLYVFISFSGNTEEVLSGFKMKYRVAAVCSGGKLKELAIKNNLPLALFPGDGLAPRQASGYLFYGAMGVIKKVFPKVLLPNFSKINPAALEKTGRKIASHLTNKAVLVYATSNNAHLAYNWKTRLNETAKHLAFSGSLPEMSHNEITPFEKRPKNIFAIFLIDSLDSSRNRKKINLISQLLNKYGVPNLKINLQGKTRLEKTWNGLILADWVSYHLAKIKKVDPESIKLIDQLKELMR